MALDHSYRQLPIPTNAPFELRPSPGMGWGAWATRRIERGTLILKEKPLFIIRKPHAEITEQDVLRSFQQLPPSLKPLLFLLRDNGSQIFRSLAHAFAENSFNMAGEDRNGQQFDGPRGLFLLHSRLNHCCRPNCKIPSGGKAEMTCLQSFATRDIVPGEEITFEYEANFACKTRDERHQTLRFVCKCYVCRPGTPLQRISDMRRRLIRGLQYLETGRGLDDQKQGPSDRPLIFDPQLKAAAENFSIPLSCRYISGLLRMVLLEQEGLLDTFLAERLSPSIRATASMFQSENNVAIARLAIAQETWSERLYVAFELYGRGDAADNAVATLFRMLQK